MQYRSSRGKFVSILWRIDNNKYKDHYLCPFVVEIDPAAESLEALKDPAYATAALEA